MTEPEHRVKIEPLLNDPETHGYKVVCSCCWMTGAPTAELAEQEGEKHLSMMRHPAGHKHRWDNPISVKRQCLDCGLWVDGGELR